MRSDRGITFDIRHSARLALILRAIILVASLAPLLSGLPWLLKVSLCVALLCHGEYRVRGVHDSPLALLEWASDGAWAVIDRHGEAFPAELSGSRVVGTQVALRLRWQGRRTTVFLMGDNSHAEDRRRLRVRLGQGPRPAGA